MQVKKKILFFILGWMMFVFLPSGMSEVNLSEFRGMPNPVYLEDDLIGGGPPPEEVIRAASEQGFKAVIDLRRPEEGTAAEEELVKNYGMAYYNIIVTPRTLSRWQVDDLAKVLSDPANRPAILHCESGNRTGALWALYRYFEQRVEADQALGEGIDKGLRGRTLKRIARALMKKR